MSWITTAREWTARFGGLGFAVRLIVRTVVPGAEIITDLIEKSSENARQAERREQETHLRRDLQTTQEDCRRLESLMTLFTGQLAGLTAQVAETAERPDESRRLVLEALSPGADSPVQAGLVELTRLAGEFDRVEEINQQALEGLGYGPDLQASLLPLLRRQAQVVAFGEEAVKAGLEGPRRAEAMEQFADSLADARAGRTEQARGRLNELREQLPGSSAVQEALAVTAALGNSPFEADRELGRAAQLRPDDPDLAEVSRRVSRATALPRAWRGTAPPRGKQPRVGDVIDGWELIEHLGYGGFGLVFRARREGQICALKVLHPEHAAVAVLVERFRREAEVLQGLPRHPNLVVYQGAGQDAQSGHWYLGMELVEGVSLQTRLDRGGRLDFGSAMRLFGQIGDGLAAVHDKGIAHRDVKPANIRLRPDGRPVLVDFGLAWVMDDGGLTRTGQGTGQTVLFASPEQLRGVPADDYRPSDVYSLAATMVYSLLFDPAQKHFEFHDPDELRGLLPDDLDEDTVVEVFEAALSRSVKKRTADAAKFRKALETLPQPLELPISCQIHHGKNLKVTITDPPETVFLDPGQTYWLTATAPLTHEQVAQLARLLPGSRLWPWSLRLAAGSTDETLALLRPLARLRRLSLDGLHGDSLVTNAGLAALAGLDELIYLDLWRCPRLTPACLRHLAALPKLEEISLDADWVAHVGEEDVAPLAELPALKALDLHGCATLTAEGLRPWRRAVEGKKLALPKVWVQQRSDEELAELGWATLDPLDLENHYHLTGACLPRLANQPLFKQQSLSLSGCEDLTDESLAHLAGLTHLEELNLSGCDRLTGAGLRHLLGLVGLQKLDLGGWRHLDDGALALLVGLTELRELSLDDCVELTGSGFEHLSGLAKLESLSLDGCKRLTDEGASRLARSGSLRRLTFPNCRRLTGAFLANFVDHPCMQGASLTLTGMDSLTDGSLTWLGRLHKLTALEIRGSRWLTGKGFDRLAGLSGLQTLKLYELPQLDGNHLPLLTRLPALTKLYLGGGCAKLTNEGVAGLRGFPKLKQLDLNWPLNLSAGQKAALVAAMPGLQIT